MKIFLLGAGLVGATIVDALHEDHDITAVDLDPLGLKRLAQRYDVATVRGTVASAEVLGQAGIGTADLVIACTDRDETNLVGGMLARTLAPDATMIVRTSNAEYAEIWRDSRLGIDYVVSSEQETARAVLGAVVTPTARYTDTFADGRVQLVELDVGPLASRDLVGRRLRDVLVPKDSRIAGIIREGEAVLPDGDTVVRAGDRVVAVGSPQAAQEWCQLVAPKRRAARSVAIFGGQELGTAIARRLCAADIGVRILEPDPARADKLAEKLPGCRVFNTSGIDPGFLAREGIGRAQTAIFAYRDDAKNLYAATLARVNGVAHTIGLVHDPASTEVYEAAGIDVSVDPRVVTAEEIVRFAHDPRTKQVSMLDNDSFEVLDVVTRPESELVGLPLKAMTVPGALIGAIVRDDKATFPRSNDILRAGDRVIVFTESRRAREVERVL